MHAHQPQEIALLLDQDFSAPPGRPAVGMPHAELRDVSLADRVEHTAAHREASVDPVAFPTGDQIIGVAAGEEQIPLIGRKDQLSCPRTIDLLQGEDVGLCTVAVLAQDLDVGFGPSRGPWPERLVELVVQVVQVPARDPDLGPRRRAHERCGERQR